MRVVRLLSALLLLVAPGCGADGSGNGHSGTTMQDEGLRLCPGEYLTGLGNVWRGHDPYALETRDLPCLAGNGRLDGYYIGSIDTSENEEAQADDHRFLYEVGDPRLDEVEAYYVITHMANWIAASLEQAGISGSVLPLLRSDEVHLDYGKYEVASKQLCYSLNMGMQGLHRAVLNVDVLTHEFGHHVVFSLNRQIGNSMLHEGLADYMAAAFTRDSAIEPSESPAFDRDVDNDRSAPGDVITREEYCQTLLDNMEQAGIEEAYPGLHEQFEACLEESPADLARPEGHWAGMILSGALWDLRRQLGEAILHPTLFRALHSREAEDTGALLDSLIEADAALHDGTNAQALANAFARHGIDQDLGLGFPELPYSACP